MSPAGTARPARIRLDELLVAQGLASSRAEAARLILAGRVRLPGGVPAKAGRLVAPDTAGGAGGGGALRRAGRGEARGGARRPSTWASEGRVCLDVGASTGGFTDCLLGRGARPRPRGGRGPRPAPSAPPRGRPRRGVGGCERAPSRSRPVPRSPEPRHDRRVLHLARQGPARRGRVPRRPGGDRGPREAAVRGRPRLRWARAAWSGRGRRAGTPSGASPARRSGWGSASGGVAASVLHGPKGNREVFLHLARDLGPRPPLEGATLEAALAAAVPAESRSDARKESVGERDRGRGREGADAAHRGGRAAGPGRGARGDAGAGPVADRPRARGRGRQRDRRRRSGSPA